MSAQTIGGTPVLILKEGTGRSTGKEAQRNNIAAAKIIAETVRTTLGPRGMDKMLVSTIGDVTITNDGATIMKELDVQHPRCWLKSPRPRTTRWVTGQLPPSYSQGSCWNELRNSSTKTSILPLSLMVTRKRPRKR